ncbi:hypothetical protein [Peribacillus loiseleuriae]|uniref:hypothetical protein n=1 Tax=Peribacillus loiseleuriae TaxID=1679170 RepID=UPI003CFEF41E
MSEGVSIKFYDLDKERELDLDEQQLLEANPDLSVQTLVEEVHNINGTILHLKDGDKRIIETLIEHDGDSITFKFQDKDKSIYKK